MTSGLFWVSVDDGSTITWTLTSFEPAATVVTTTPGSGGSGGSWTGALPLDFGSTNHSDVVYLFNDLGGNIYGWGIDDDTLVSFAPNGGGHWDFRRATATPSGWDGTTLARIDDDGNLLANGGTSSAPGHAFLAEASLGLYRQAAGVIGATGHLRPATNGASDLGSTSLRWAALWAGAATLASAAIAGGLAVAGVLGLSDGSSGAPSAAFTSEATLGLYRQASGTIGATGHLKPSANVTHALGDSSHRWNNVYSGGLDLSGNATIAGTLNAGASTLGATTAASLNATPIGGTTPAAGAFTTLSSSGAATLNSLSVTNNATVGGTLGVTGAVSGASTITAGTGLIATTGGVTASAGNVVATLGNITAAAGNVAATLGSVSAGTTLSAGTSASVGTFLTVGSYLDVTGPIGLGVTHDATKGKLYLLDSTGKPFRFGYDATHYAQLLVDNGGNTIFDAPQNSITLQPGSASGYFGGVVYPYSSLATDLGAYNRKNRVLYAGELNVDVLVAQSVLATVGGRIMVCPTSRLFGDLASGATTVYLDNYAGTFAANDIVYLADAPGGVAQYEFIKLGTKTGPTTDPTTGRVYYTFTGCTRDLDHHTPSPFNGKDWKDGDTTANTGGSSSTGGLIDLTSTVGYVAAGGGAVTANGPAITIYSRTGTAYNSVKPTVSLGNLRGFADIGSNDYHGIAFGNDLTLSPTTGFRGMVADANNGSMRLFSTDLKMYGGLGSTQTGDWRASDGRLLVGSNVSAVATTSFAVFPASVTWGSDTPPANSVLIGPGSKGNVYFDGTDLHIRQAQTDLFKFLTTTDSRGYYAQFSKPFELQSNAGIGYFPAYGTSGTFTSPSGSGGSGPAGLRLWSDGSNAHLESFVGVNVISTANIPSMRITSDAGRGYPMQFYDSRGPSFWTGASSIASMNMVAHYGASGMQATAPSSTGAYIYGGDPLLGFTSAVKGVVHFEASGRSSGGSRNTAIGGFVTDTSPSSWFWTNCPALINLVAGESTVPTSGLALDVRGLSAGYGLRSRSSADGAYQTAAIDFTRNDGTTLGYFLTQRSNTGLDASIRCSVPNTSGTAVDVWYANYNSFQVNVPLYAYGASSNQVIAVVNRSGDGAYWIGASHSATPDFYLFNASNANTFIVKHSAETFLGYGGSSTNVWVYSGSYLRISRDDNANDHAFRITPTSGTALTHYYTVGGGTPDATGGSITSGGVFSSASDRNRKTAFRDVDPAWVVERFRALPAPKAWKYKTQAAEPFEHYGLFAQDFHAAFGFGPGETLMTPVDTFGVTTALLQHTLAATDRHGAEIAALRAEVAALKARLD